MQNYAPGIFDLFIPSNSGIKKAIKKGQFLINGNIAETGTWINSGQVIELIEDPNNKPKVYKFDIEVIFEDEHVAAINKPAGIIVSGNTFKTIFSALPHNLKKSNEPDALLLPTPVHRLDNQTSGILLIAKTKTAQIELGKQFSNKTIQKTYSTIVVGMVETNLTIKTPIEDKPSETSFEILEVFNSLKHKKLSFLKVSPKTGRTHQIRIHLASINYPILGDKLYGNPETIHKGKGLFLAATEVKFLHPKTFENVVIKIEVPQKFTSLIKREKRRWDTYNEES
ncbi:RluA family pseudouridine synthase [Lutibacter sp. HS1-25]|uniref:RluA family pseudouridine synthase n=1 Tax=Lutibacter sp. HS1-25 TaxID=2485000 RepID=UPI001F0C6B58|nr:RluA family pseudouridine synthase [Lutibacter sp. HS1-25]